LETHTSYLAEYHVSIRDFVFNIPSLRASGSQQQSTVLQVVGTTAFTVASQTLILTAFTAGVIAEVVCVAALGWVLDTHVRGRTSLLIAAIVVIIAVLAYCTARWTGTYAESAESITLVTNQSKLTWVNCWTVTVTLTVLAKSWLHIEGDVSAISLLLKMFTQTIDPTNQVVAAIPIITTASAFRLTGSLSRRLT
jgi:hypothetical protein